MHDHASPLHTACYLDRNIFFKGLLSSLSFHVLLVHIVNRKVWKCVY